jgi:hypothetical protein
MGRVINTDSPGKRRNQNMRTSAEILRRLSQKNGVDDDVMDMVALLMFVLRDIDNGIDESAAAWEKRDYWIKAEEFRQRWHWAGENAAAVEKLLRDNAWQQLPEVMLRLLPHFADIKITKFTRKESLWDGCYARFREEVTS